METTRWTSPKKAPPIFVTPGLKVLPGHMVCKEDSSHKFKQELRFFFFFLKNVAFFLLKLIGFKTELDGAAVRPFSPVFCQQCQSSLKTAEQQPSWATVLNRVAVKEAVRKGETALCSVSNVAWTIDFSVSRVNGALKFWVMKQIFSNTFSNAYDMRYKCHVCLSQCLWYKLRFSHVKCLPELSWHFE